MNLKCLLLGHKDRILETYPLSMLDVMVCNRCHRTTTRRGKLASGEPVTLVEGKDR